MTVATFNQPNNTTMTGAQYLAAIDGDFSVFAGVAGQFAPHAQASANMTVVVDAGSVLNDITLTSKAQQITSVITAPTNGTQRIDRIVVSQTTGNVSVITGTQSNSPAVPALVTGNFPVAQVLLLANSTVITNSMITDERKFVNSNANTANTAITAINLSGGTVNATTVNAFTEATLAYAYRARADLTDTVACIQFTNNAQTLEWTKLIATNGLIRCNTAYEVDGTLYAAGGRIQFPATQSASSDPNCLDDYEEGTWTPVLAFGGTSTGITYGTQVGSYTKIGRLVTVFMVITLTSKGSSTGVARITGLPFTLPNLNVSNSPAPLFTWYQMNTALYSLFGTPGVNTDYISVMKITAATTSSFGSTAADTDFTNTSSLWLSFSYQV